MISIPQTCKVENCYYSCKQMRRGYCMWHYMQLKDSLNLTRYSREDVLKPRKAILDGDAAKIPLGINAKDGYALVDKDKAHLAEMKWTLDAAGYASTSNRHIRMQHMIMKCPKGLQIDHINRNRIDNRTANLRIVTRSQNVANTSFRSATGYKGVCKLDRTRITPNTKKIYRAYIKPYEKQISLGMYETAEEAAKAYDKAARKYFGEYAYLNFPREL